MDIFGDIYMLMYALELKKYSELTLSVNNWSQVENKKL